MTFAKAARTLGWVTVFMVASPFALADDSGWYVGGNVGDSKAQIDDARIESGLLSGGIATSSITDDERHFGYKIFGGFRFDKYLAFESGYFDLGRFGFTAHTVPLGTLDGDIKLKGLNFDVVGTVPITGKFSAFGRVGVIYADTKDTFSGTGSVNVLDPDRSRRAANYKFGAGLEYDFIRSLGARIEAERYRIDDAVGNKGDVDLFSVGLVYRFGGETPLEAPVPPAPVPEPVAAAPVPPPPSPPPPPPPPPPRPKKVTFSADSLFDFGKATVRVAGKQALDTFAADLRGTSFEVITVTGYTDRIGAHEYNVKLSTRRAEAVKAYLVESAGIPPDKIAARGADGSDPVTKPGDCSGTRATRQLVECLQPDRRVEIEVSGTK